MNTNIITRLAGTVVGTGLATVALALPASAMVTPGPVGHGGSSQATTSTQSAGVSADSGPWLELGLGALGGVAIGAAGLAGASALRHRRPVPQG